MGLFLLAGGISLLLLPGVTRRLGRRLAPAEWARLCGVALLTGGLVTEVSAVLYAAPTVLRAAGVHAWAAACERALGPLVPGGILAGWVAAAAAIGLPFSAFVAVRRARRSSRRIWMEASVGSHSSCGGHELVELPTDSLLAISVPAPSPQIIVSAGLARVLEPHELQAVVEHERAHLDLNHHRYLLLASALEGFHLRPIRASARAIRAAVERWADETVAGGGPEARKAVRSALLQLAGAEVTPGVAAFSTADSVIERLDALARPPRRPSTIVRGMLYAPGTVLAAALTLGLGASLSSAQALMAVANHCPV